jgi:hypothetical protein
MATHVLKYDCANKRFWTGLTVCFHYMTTGVSPWFGRGVLAHQRRA